MSKTIYLKEQELAKIQVTISQGQELVFDDYFSPNRVTITRLIETTLDSYVIN
ncbi:MAG: hypothetical protein U0176_12695 [Bacteroidia bacterium]